MNPTTTGNVCLQALIAWALAAAAVGTSHAQQTEPWQANPQLVQKLSESRAEFNYDESRVPDYALPDALTTQAGQSVTSAKQWQSIRRDELLELFRNEVYGRRPTTEVLIEFEPLKSWEQVFDGRATAYDMLAKLTIDDRHFQFPFTVFLPNHVSGKVPAVILINNRYSTPVEKAIAETDAFWPVRELIERGYATASFHTSDVDPDRKDGYAEGVRAFFADGQEPADDAWRSLSAWGWAASRVLDYLATLDAVDATRVAVVGHSRGGKTALWAACEDPRFSVAYSNNSGCGGAALSRRTYGETVARITSSFPHWFCKNFSAYAGKEADLPVDQHEVIGLLAPRAVYVTSADEDLWADPRGEYLSLVSAAPVYELLGQKAISDHRMPALNQATVVGQTGYHIRSGGHGLEAEDWKLFLDFADIHLKPAAR